MKHIIPENMAPNSIPLCGRCSALNVTRADFEDSPFEPEGKYRQVIAGGTIGELRMGQSACSLCWLLLQALSQHLEARPGVLVASEQEWEAEWYQNTFEYEPAAIGVEDQYGSALWPRLKGEATSDYGV